MAPEIMACFRPLLTHLRLTINNAVLNINMNTIQNISQTMQTLEELDLKIDAVSNNGSLFELLQQGEALRYIRIHLNKDLKLNDGKEFVEGIFRSLVGAKDLLVLQLEVSKNDLVGRALNCAQRFRLRRTCIEVNRTRLF